MGNMELSVKEFHTQVYTISESIAHTTSNYHDMFRLFSSINFIKNISKKGCLAVFDLPFHPLK